MKRLVFTALLLLSALPIHALDNGELYQRLEGIRLHRNQIEREVRNLSQMLPNLSVSDESEAGQRIADATFQFMSDVDGTVALGQLAGQMRCPDDAKQVREVFDAYLKAAVISADVQVKALNFYIVSIKGAAILAEITKIREKSISIQNALNAL